MYTSLRQETENAAAWILALEWAAKNITPELRAAFKACSSPDAKGPDFIAWLQVSKAWGEKHQPSAYQHKAMLQILSES